VKIPHRYRKSIIIVLLISMALAAWKWNAPFYSVMRSFLGRYSPTPLKRYFKCEPWITVFVHGTFGTTLGLLSFFPVVNDDLNNSVYKKTTRKMRKDEFFFKNQPMLQRGLVKVTPTFDLAATNGKTLAAYPLAAAYHTVAELAQPHQEQIAFYTFGWSGLLSKHQRRHESIRFYNALQEELARYHAQGIYPKVRIIGHSHGGNFVLHFAGINHLAVDQRLTFVSDNPFQREELKLLRHIIDRLPSREVACTKEGQKAWDYQPEYPRYPLVIVDELIMMGTPIQPETDHYTQSDTTFKRIYNVYSDEDIVQASDWVSTQRRYSAQRIDTEQWKSQRLVGKVHGNNVIQMRVIVREPLRGALAATTPIQSQKTPWWRRFFLFREKTLAPSHKELWFIMWTPENTLSEYEHYLTPLPTLVVLPFFTRLIDVTHAATKCSDVDVIVCANTSSLETQIVDHNNERLLASHSFPLPIIENIKQHIALWKPEEPIKEKEFERISAYVRESAYSKKG
jgi:hypothetical protein